MSATIRRGDYVEWTDEGADHASRGVVVDVLRADRYSYRRARIRITHAHEVIRPVSVLRVVTS